ncbi:Outer membrane efflux protein [Aquisphaera giovannonii]|uniref:Outer membrane efflux protein n=1 Tax=Aquisphaera giovannonii TaxID=406548 RepID=A0A5B9VYT2_9BACT|nr:TolC family protein [Aquisphaera giovannonii]QEH33452.1 Outer membrane efflux protein [Aquisphaera giovannonii]
MSRPSLVVAIPAFAVGIAIAASTGGSVLAQSASPLANPASTAVPEPLPTVAREPGTSAVASADANKEGAPPPPPVSPPTILHPETRPIDLNTALQLAGVQNPELNAARQRVLESVALRQLAAAQFLPSINPGMNYDSHAGNLQQSNGNILSVNRSAVYVGAGSMAVAAGTVAVPGVFLSGNTALGVFRYLESRQFVRQREFENVAIRNQVFLRTVVAFSELLRSEARHAVALQNREEARGIARLTRDYAETGQGRMADANRAATELQRREAYLKGVEAELVAASAALCQVLNLDPTLRLHPTDAFVVPQPLVPDPIPVNELIALGLLQRPELGAQRASIIQGILALQTAKLLPFSPTVYLGFSAGGFGGGSNLVRPILGGFGGRTDFDVAAYWTIQNLGVGNLAMIRGADANLQVRRFEQLEVLNMVREQIAESYARTHARFAQIETNEAATRSGLLSFTQDLTRIRYRSRDVLPIELLDSFRLLAQARIDYADAIVDYNEAQFQLYVALGQPPANSLARPVPTQGITPSGVTGDNPRVTGPARSAGTTPPNSVPPATPPSR